MDFWFCFVWGFGLGFGVFLGLFFFCMVWGFWVFFFNLLMELSYDKKFCTGTFIEKRTSMFLVYGLLFLTLYGHLQLFHALSKEQCLTERLVTQD